MLIGIDANEANLTSHRVGINEYAFNILHGIYSQTTPHKFVIYLKSSPLADLPTPRADWSYRIIPFPKLWTQTRLPFDLFTHSPKPDVFFSATHYAPRWSPSPTIVSIMDLGFISSPEHFLKKDLHQLTSWTNYSIANAAKVITISEFTRREVIGHYGKSSESVVSIPLGYNSSLFKVHQKADIQIPRELGITSPYILFLSSLKPSKNVVRLVQAFNLVSQDYPDLKLVIAGKKAWLFEEIFSEVVRLGLEDKVIFTGFIKDALKPVLMAASKVFVMPSLYEGFSITLLEAMACGVPVVASNIPSQVEVAGTACILVDPLDSTSIASGIIQALGPKGDASAKLGLARVKLFDWSKTAKLTLGVIESACKK